MTIAGQALMILGALALLIAAVAVLRLPDALTRQHGVALGVLAVPLVAAGTALVVRDPGWAIRLALLVGAMLFMIPSAANLLSRVATLDEGREEDARHAPTSVS
jgi:multicomponent Na+:H+ antiporter subunit G